RGFLESGTFALHPSKPTVFGGFAIPLPFAALSCVEAREGLVSVRYDIGPGVEGLTEPLGANLPCADLAIAYTTFEPSDALGDLSKATDAQLRLGHPIDLRVQPGQKVVAQQWARVRLGRRIRASAAHRSAHRVRHGPRRSGAAEERESLRGTALRS